MSEQFFEDFAPNYSAEVLRELITTEQAVADYAAIALRESTVSVTINDCRHPFMHLPQTLKSAMDFLPKQPQSITCVDLQLNYSPEMRQFTTLFAGLKFDNKYSLIFHQLKSRLPNQEGELFYGAVLNPAGGIVKRTAETQLIPAEAVAEILDVVGVGVPKAPQEASWEEIKAILQFAGLWTATTAHSTPLDLVRTLKVTDRVEGSSLDTSTATLDSNDGIRSREIVLSIDHAKDIMEPASVCWKLTASKIIQSEDRRNELPRIKTLERIPLEFRLPVFEDYGTEILGELPYVRHEQTDQAESLGLHPQYLQAVREAIAEALNDKSN